MEQGEVRQKLQTTQPEQPTRKFLDEAIRQLANDLGAEVGELPMLNVFVTYYDLPSRYNRLRESDDRLMIIWHNERPAATSLETRTERNEVLTQSIYHGPQEPDAHEA
jgi:hypothetical protein